MIVLASLIVGYAVYAEHAGEKQADDFCQQIAPGVPTAGIRERTIAFGAMTKSVEWVKDAGGKEQMLAVFNRSTPISRHICSVNAKNGRVISKRISYLD